jgi:hypothetical protein
MAKYQEMFERSPGEGVLDKERENLVLSTAG